MEIGLPSATAIGAAMARAAHIILDDDPKIFRDPLALGLSGLGSEGALRATMGDVQSEIALQSTPQFAERWLKLNRAAIALGQRCVTDELHKALESGVQQYVILGAGLDSFAYTRPDLVGTLRVFEVDHPATQEWKRSRLRELQIDLPPNLMFVSADMEYQFLAERLGSAGFRPELPAFISWLGVTMYLTEEAVFDTLRYVASLSPKSEIVFQYVLPELLLSEEDRCVSVMLRRFAASRGEPWLTSFDPGDLADRVSALGLTLEWDLGGDEASARYFAGRTDGLRISNLGHLVKARVGGAA